MHSGDVAHQSERKRTVWLWLILVWITYSGVSYVLSLAMYLLGIRVIEAPVVGVHQYILDFVAHALLCGGGLALFYFRTISVWLFLGGTVMMAISLLLAFFDPALQEFIARTLGHAGWFVQVGGFAYGVLMGALPLIYAVVLRRRNWLR